MAGRMARPVPEFEELVTLLQACLRNAGALLADARVFLASGRAPRAHAVPSSQWIKIISSHWVEITETCE